VSTILFGGPANAGAAGRAPIVSRTPSAFHPLPQLPVTNRNGTAVVYCEGNFGKLDGKTANGLVRQSETYEIVSVIDSEKAGLDSGTALGDAPNSIPVCRDLEDSLSHTEFMPDYFIYGMAPASGVLSMHERNLLLEAIDLGMNIVNGLHEFLNDDPEFAAASLAAGVSLLDIRKPRAEKYLHTFSGRVHEVTCPRIAILGTDCAIGKRTTATILTRALVEHGIKAVLVSTGQTGLMQGGRYGAALDAVPSQFCAGEMEAAIVDAFKSESPDVIIIEGQGALSHPAYSTTAFILRGSCPDAVVLQHAPGRTNRCDFEQWPMPDPTSEIQLIETFSETRVVGLTINHENMNDGDIDDAVEYYRGALGIPVTDPTRRPANELVDLVCAAFPKLVADSRAVSS
jgi:uncharacterized NAD-dependent epimerase/dehydratase family protein